MVLDAKVIEAQLQELTVEKVKVKLDKQLDIATSIRETDNGYVIQLNPSRIRNQDKLDKQLNFCRGAITHYQ